MAFTVIPLITSVSDELEFLEGRRYVAYPDPLTHADPWTNGVGHTGPDVFPGQVVDDTQVNAWKDRDIGKVSAQCMSALPWFATMNDARQAVLICMGFQMGFQGLVAFHHMLSSCAVGDFSDAAEQMMQSKWAAQTPNRAELLHDQMLSGNWPTKTP